MCVYVCVCIYAYIYIYIYVYIHTYVFAGSGGSSVISAGSGGCAAKEIGALEKRNMCYVLGVSYCSVDLSLYPSYIVYVSMFPMMFICTCSAPRGKTCAESELAGHRGTNPCKEYLEVPQKWLRLCLSVSKSEDSG